MSLRGKVLLIIGVSLFTLIALSYAVSQAIVQVSVAQGEEQSSRRSVERALEILADTLSDVNATAGYLAQWDATDRFIQDSNSGFAEDNTGARAFSKLQLNLMVLIDSSGRMVLGKAFDLENQRPLPLYAGLEESLTDLPTRNLLLNHLNINSSRTGPILLPEGTLLIAARPIVSTDGKGPINGTLIIGRLLDPAQIELLSKATGTSVTLRRLDDPRMPPDFQVAASALSQQAPIFVRPESEQTIAGYTFISDIFGKPILALKAESPRYTYQQAQTNMRYLLFALLLLGLAGSLTIVFSVDRVVLTPLAWLSAAVGKIGANGNLAARVGMVGKNEFARLSDAINGMLETIECSQQKQHESEESYRSLLQKSADPIYIYDFETKHILEANAAFLSFTGYSAEQVQQLTPFDVAAHTPESIEDYLHQALKIGGVKIGERKWRRKDGTHVDVDVSLSRDRHGAKDIVFVIARDISERKRLEQGEHEQRALAEALRDTAAALNSTLDFDGVLDQILANIERVVVHEAANLMLVESGSAHIVRSRDSGMHDGALMRLRFQVAELNTLRFMLETQQPLAIPDTQAFPGWVDIPETRWIRSYLGAPVLAKNQVIGFLNLASATPSFFTPEHAARLHAFADQAAIALENARLLAESKRAVRELDALNKIARRINSTLDLQQVLDLTMQEVKDLLAVEVCSLMLLEEQTQELVFHVALGPGAEQTKQMRLSIREGIAGFVAREGQSLIVNDVRGDPRWYSRVDASTGFVTRSILAVPLKSKEKVIGVIEVINKLEQGFTSNNLELLNSIAMPVATAIENARFFGEMVQSRAQILESRNTLRALFDGITADVFIVDRNLRILAINRAAASASGEEPQNLIGKLCQDVVCGSAEHCSICPINDAFRTQKTMLRDDHRIGEDGTARELEVATWPLENAEGEVDRVIYIAQDVTEKRRMEATLVQSARLSAVGELAASVTHEIGNPLTAVIGNAQMLLRILDPKDPSYEMAQLIERAGQRVDKVVHNLLNLSRQEQYHFAPVDLNASIEDALSLVAYQLERDQIEVIREFQNDLPLVRASASYLETVWANLLLNAKDAMTKERKAYIRITTRLTEDKQAVQILFEDNGKGIDELGLSRIFDPFFTTKPRGKGTGLGLYISSVVIAHHHGTLQAYSQLGQGSSFVVTLSLENGIIPAASRMQRI